MSRKSCFLYLWILNILSCCLLMLGMACFGECSPYYSSTLKNKLKSRFRHLKSSHSGSYRYRTFHLDVFIFCWAFTCFSLGLRKWLTWFFIHWVCSEDGMIVRRKWQIEGWGTRIGWGPCHSFCPKIKS